jgi:ribonuclease HII
MRRCGFRFEKKLRAGGITRIGGIDEAGRGALAGPVVAAVAVLPEKFRHKKLRDSKQLSPERREEIYEQITSRGDIVWGIGVVDSLEIDEINILRATHKAMRATLETLAEKPEHVLIDGLPVHPFPLPQTAVVDGDCLSLSIAAASVIAKVTRDRLMREFCARFPEYCFSQHKGYGTELHLMRLHAHGPCAIHRRSFEPVAQPLFAFAQLREDLDRMNRIDRMEAAESQPSAINHSVDSVYSV